MEFVEKDLFEEVSAIDTCTLSNAIEKLAVRNRTEGFCSRDIKCLFPELGVMAGYAVTAEVETMSTETAQLDTTFVDLCKAIESTEEPAVVVLKEVTAQQEFSAHCGEVMATIFKRLGAAGLVSDSGVRDIPEVRELGFHYFAPGAVASHGNFHIKRIQVPVTVGGLQIEPGDLLHGDINGLIKVPEQGMEKLSSCADDVRNAEQSLLEYVKSDSFTVENLYERFTH
ncbi:MAG: RraA family protein [Planctomycetota bacterium]|jgi:regulator of RNase E activity RraA